MKFHFFQAIVMISSKVVIPAQAGIYSLQSY
jgi:hypothetical protein